MERMDKNYLFAWDHRDTRGHNKRMKPKILFLEAYHDYVLFTCGK